MENLGRTSTGARPDRLQFRLYHISICMAALSAAFWCFFNFLTAEDAIVLFNRFNYLEGAPTFFYYAGYTSILPQFASFLFSAMNPAIQAVLYSLTAFAVFLLLLREVFLVTRSGLISILLVSICAVFFPFVIYNLTFSFWAGVAILGLVGLRCHTQRDAPSLRDTLICLPGLAGSPLTIVYFPLFAWVSLTSKSPNALFITIGTVASFFGLAEHGAARANSEGLVSTLIVNAASVLEYPLQYLINFGNPSDLAVSALGSLAFLVVFAAGVLSIWRWKVAGLPVALYAMGSLLAVVAAFAASSVPLAGRYWFPVLVCALALFGRFWTISAPHPARRGAEAIVVAMLCMAILANLGVRFEKWGGAETGLKEWRMLASPPPNMTAIVRDWHGDAGRWAIGAGQGKIPYGECAGLWEHPHSAERFGFRIYCGRAVFR